MKVLWFLDAPKQPYLLEGASQPSTTKPTHQAKFSISGRILWSQHQETRDGVGKLRNEKVRETKEETDNSDNW